MPHIRMRGLPEQAVALISQELPGALAKICEVIPAAFILDWVNSSCYRDGHRDMGRVQVEVLWFPKDPETHHLAELAIREAVTRAYPELQQIVVMFMTLEPGSYYKDGKHY